MKKHHPITNLLHLVLLFTLAGVIFFGCQKKAHAQTNAPDSGGLNFTNVSIEAWTGYQYQGNSGESTALIGASIDIGSFNAGKLGVIDWGLGTEFAIGAVGSAVKAGSLRAELIKNLDSAQVLAFIGVGRNFEGASWFTEFGVGLNYNLYRARSWSSYVGTGCNFHYAAAKLDYLPVVRTGIAF